MLEEIVGGPQVCVSFFLLSFINNTAAFRYFEILPFVNFQKQTPFRQRALFKRHRLSFLRLRDYASRLYVDET